jgi:hypothetical protein
MLNSRGSVHWPRVPQLRAGEVRARDVVGVDLLALLGLAVGDGLLQVVARNRLWHERHSVSGSVKAPTCPEATHTWRGRMIEESSPTTSSRA